MGIKVSREFLLSKKSNFIRFRSNFSYLDRLCRRLTSPSVFKSKISGSIHKRRDLSAANVGCKWNH